MDLAQVAWLAALALMLGGACWHDASRRRIPNEIVFAGAALGFAIATTPSGIGAVNAAGGLAAGLGAGLLLHFFRVMAAGDVKLLAAIGAFVGFPGILAVLAYTLVAGGILAFAWALARRRLRGVLGNVAGAVRDGASTLAAGMLPRGQRVTAVGDAIPYAVAIAAGTAAHLALGGALAWRLQ